MHVGSPSVDPICRQVYAYQCLARSPSSDEDHRVRHDFHLYSENLLTKSNWVIDIRTN